MAKANLININNPCPEGRGKIEGQKGWSIKFYPTQSEAMDKVLYFTQCFSTINFILIYLKC